MSLRSYLCILFYILLLIMPAWADHSSLRNDTFETLPDSGIATFRTNSQRIWDHEEAQREGRQHVPFVYSGGIHGTSGSFTSATFATEAFVPERINQTATAITYVAIADDVCWTIISSDNNGIAGWTRVGTTAYYYQCEGDTTPNQPALPTNSTWLMQVTIAASAISDVSPMTNPLSLPLTTINGRSALFYGMKCDGVTDDTKAFQRTIDAAKNGLQGIKIVLPTTATTCIISSTVTIDSVLHVIIDGQNVLLQWAGNATSPLLLFRDVRESEVKNFRILSTVTAPLLAAIQIENGPNVTVTPTQNLFENITIECTNGGCTNGVHIASGAGGDANNELHIFRRVHVSNYTNAAYKLVDSQQHAIVFEDSTCSGNLIGSYCVQVDPRGSFHWIRGGGGGNIVADFSILNATLPIIIEGLTSEASTRFLLVGPYAGSSGAGQNVTVRAVRWVSSTIPVDGRIIALADPGPLTVQDSLFSCNGTGIYPHIFVSGGGQRVRVNVFGNYFQCSGYTGSIPYDTIETTLPRGTMTVFGNTHTSSVNMNIGWHFSDVVKHNLTVDVRKLGAQCNGSVNPLSALFTTVTDAQSFFPAVSSLTQNLDWAAIQTALNLVADGGTVELPSGTCILGSTNLGITRNVTLKGQGWGMDAAGAFVGSRIATTGLTPSEAVLSIDTASGTPTANIHDIIVDAVNINPFCVKVGGGGALWQNMAWKHVLLANCTTGINLVGATKSTFEIDYKTVTTNIALSGSTVDNTFFRGGDIYYTGNTFANLGTALNGATKYCTDCTKTTPCAGAGTGALAKRFNSAWDCN